MKKGRSALVGPFLGRGYPERGFPGMKKGRSAIALRPFSLAGERLKSGVHALEEIGVVLGRAQLVEQELDRVDRAHRREDAAQDIRFGQRALLDQQLVLAGARAHDVDGREDALVGDLAVQNDFAELPVPLNSSKITSSMRLPVSISAVAMMVSEPPSSILRAAPKKRLGRCRALASTPPVSTLPDEGTTVL